MMKAIIFSQAKENVHTAMIEIGIINVLKMEILLNIIQMDSLKVRVIGLMIRKMIVL